MPEIREYTPARLHSLTPYLACDDPTAAIAWYIEVFDAQGRRIATPFDGALARGRSSVVWGLTTREGASVANGVYFARLGFAGGNRTVQVAVAR